MIRLFTLMLALLVPSLVNGQTYPSAEMLREFPTEVYVAAKKADVIAIKLEKDVAAAIKKISAAEASLRQALQENWQNEIDEAYVEYIVSFGAMPAGIDLTGATINVLNEHRHHQSDDFATLKRWSDAAQIYNRNTPPRMEMNKELVKEAKEKLGIPQ